jgi:hypothetical protein
LNDGGLARRRPGPRPAPNWSKSPSIVTYRRRCHALSTALDNSVSELTRPSDRARLKLVHRDDEYRDRVGCGRNSSIASLAAVIIDSRGLRAICVAPTTDRTSPENFFGTGNIFSERGFASIAAEELRLREQVHDPAASVKYEPAGCPGSGARGAPPMSCISVRKNTATISAKYSVKTAE